jgi:PPOX class probable F420-dependent enzyme
MSAEISPAFAQRIERAYYVWFTTVRADGQPQPTPVWFVREGDEFVIYSSPDARKVKNVLANPKVALSYTESLDAEDYLVVMGEARIDKQPSLPSKHAAYHAKYANGIIDIGMTDESFDARFSVAIYVTPTRVRGE